MNRYKRKIRNYLKSLTKEQLIDLIFKFALRSFLDTQKASSTEDAIRFIEAVTAINTIFADDAHLLFAPKEFASELLKQLEKIRGLWDKFPSEIGNLLLKIIEDIDQACEDGYLYVENYHKEDEEFESEDIDDYIFSFMINLPLDMKSDYAEKLKEILNNCRYSSFPSLEQKLSRSL